MSFRPLPPIESIYSSPSGDDANSITSSTTSKSKDALKKMWCETQWTNLSMQAKTLGLSKLPYFVPETMLLSKEVNEKLWKQLGRLYNHLGAEKAFLATPIMLEGGEVKWYSFIGDDRGHEAEIYNV